MLQFRLLHKGGWEGKLEGKENKTKKYMSPVNIRARIYFYPNGNMQHVQIVNQEPTTPPPNISEPHSMFIKRRNDFERLRKVGLIYNTSVMDAALCRQDPVFSNDGFTPQLFRQFSTVNLFPELPPLKEFPHSRSTSRAAYN